MALSLILIISVVIISIATTIAFTSIGEMQSSVGIFKGENEYSFTQSCAEEVLMRINLNPNFSAGSLNLPEGTCIITINPGGGGPVNWDLTLSSNNTKFQRKIRLQFIRTPPQIKITNWKDLLN